MNHGEDKTVIADAFVRTRDGNSTWLNARDVLYALERLPSQYDVPFLLDGYHPIAAVQVADRGVYLWDAGDVDNLDQGKITGNLDCLLRGPSRKDIVDALRNAPEWAVVYRSFAGGIDTIRLRERDAEDGDGLIISFEHEGSTYGCKAVADIAVDLPELPVPPLPEIVTVDKVKYDTLLWAIDEHEAAINSKNEPQPTWAAVANARRSLSDAT